MVIKKVKRYGNSLCIFLNKRDGFKDGENVIVSSELIINNNEPNVSYKKENEIEIRETDIIINIKIEELTEKVNYLFSELDNWNKLMNSRIIDTKKGKISLNEFYEETQYLKNTMFKKFREFEEQTKY